MAKYMISFDKFSIYNTMARHTDTDFVYFTGKAGQQLFGPFHQAMGDLNNGDYWLNWDMGPFDLEPGKPFAFHYMVVNHGGGDDVVKAKTDLELASKITAVVGSVVALVPPAAIVGGVLEAIAAGGELLAFLLPVIDPNCDGIVLQDAMTGTAETLDGWTHPTGLHSETRNYEGPNTATGCGSNAQYSATWTAHWLEKAKESKEGKERKEGKEKDKERGHLENLPVGVGPQPVPPGRSPFRPTPWDVRAV
ncbi:MAG: hypothetical protein WAL84_04240 [Candidatus Dormiibacterota bacterium]